MRNSLHRSESRARQGYTLLEMLLVLTVLVVLAGVAWSSLEGVYGRHRLRRVGAELRVKMATTRIRAIDAGLIYQFRYEPTGRRFLVIPYERSETESAATSGTAAAGSESSLWKLAGELPEEFQFEQTDSQQSFTQQIPADWLIGLPGSLELDSVNWSSPILFLPDGSAMDAVLDVYDSEERFVRLSVRGLTAAVSVGQVQRRTL